MKIFSLRLADALKMAEMTQDEASTYIGYSQATISNWMSGRTEPKSHVQEHVIFKIVIHIEKK